MLKNKVKELLKNKKIIAVGAFVVVALGLAGATIALSSNATPINEVSKANEVSNKQDNSKDNKKEENKKADNKKADNKKEDTKKGEAKKEENNNSPVEDKEANTRANEEGGDKTLAVANTGNTQDVNLDSSSANTSNSNSSSSVSNSSSNTSNTNTGSSSSSNTSNASSTVAPSKPSEDHDHTHDHVHNWVPITQQITHPEEGYWADELVSGAWTEEIPVYEERARDICNGCGLDITEDPWTHAEEQILAGNYACMGYHTEYRQFQVGTNTVHHDAIYSKKWIVSSPAWVETVTTGYQCSICGDIK